MFKHGIVTATWARGRAAAYSDRPHAQLSVCYQCHCAVDLRGLSLTPLRSGHSTRVGTCAYCGTTITRIVH